MKFMQDLITKSCISSLSIHYSGVCVCVFERSNIWKKNLFNKI